ncbi:MAG: hypothetical protein ACO3A4_11830 [Silvanigrellaceae bacterium]
MKKLSISIFVVAASGFVSLNALAFGKFLNQFSEHYDANNISTQNLSDSQSCGICHVRAGGGGKRTPYGEDFRDTALGDGKGFPGIEFIDSDQDGFLNLEEIHLQTSPGHADSKPAGRIELSLKADSTLVLTPAGNCSQMDLIAFGFQFSDKTNVAKLANVSGSASLKVEGNSGAILAKCDGEQLSGSILK